MIIINNRYKVIKSIGRGGMGEVFKVRDLKDNGKVRAVKTIESGKSDLNLIKHFKNEFRIMMQLYHPNLVEVYDFGFDRINKIYFLVMECLNGQSLEIIKNMHNKPKDVVEILIQLLRVLEFIHTRNILFRDLKPENIFYNVTKNEIKLFDFGLSDFKKAETLTVKGSVQYLSPEVVHKGKIDQRSDIFSFGILMTEIFSRKDFYTDEELPEILSIMSSKKMFDNKLKLNLKNITDPKLHKIIKKALAYQAQFRYKSCADIIDELNRLCYTSTKPIETHQTKLAYIQECDYFDYTGCLKTSLQLLRKSEIKIVEVLGSSGCGKTRTLREFKYYCQLHNMNILSSENKFTNTSKSIMSILKIISIKLEASYCPYSQKINKAFSYTDCIKNKKILSDDQNGFVHLLAKMVIDYVLLQKQKTIIILDDLHKYDKISLQIIDQIIYLLQQSSVADSQLKFIVSVEKDWDARGAYKHLYDSKNLYVFDLAKMTVAQLKKYLKYHLGIKTPKAVIDSLVKMIVKFDFTPNLVKRLLGHLFTEGLLDKKSSKWHYIEDH